MEQTRLESSIEASVNMLTGFLISYFLWIAVVEFSGGKANIPDPFFITSLFTVTSLMRSYIWRRFFNAGLHKAVHKAVSAWR